MDYKNIDGLINRYERAENTAMACLPNRVIEAFSPVTFLEYGYPMRIRSIDELWRYVDVMHEGRESYITQYLLGGKLNHKEVDFFQRAVRLVWETSDRLFRKPAFAAEAILRALYQYRVIKSFGIEGGKKIIEIGPGSGYLGLFLTWDGFRYISTEVTQPFYLWQHALYQQAGEQFSDLLEIMPSNLKLKDFLDSPLVHVPWWHWANREVLSDLPRVDIVAANHVLCEMNQMSSKYLAAISNCFLADDGSILVEGWGHDELRSQQSLLGDFDLHGYGLRYNRNDVGIMQKKISFSDNYYKLPGRIMVKLSRLVFNFTGLGYFNGKLPSFGIWPSKFSPDKPASMLGNQESVNLIDVLKDVRREYKIPEGTTSQDASFLDFIKQNP